MCDSTTVELLSSWRAPPSTRARAGASSSPTGQFPDRPVRRSRALPRDRDREIAWLDPTRSRAPRRGRRRRARRHAGDVALVTLSHVNYRSGRDRRPGGDHGARPRRRCARAVGPVALRRRDPGRPRGAGVDLAVGCTYKYLNGGPARRPTSTSAPSSRRSSGTRSRAGSARPTSSRWARASSRGRASPGGSPGRPAILGLAAAEEGIRLSVEAGIERIRAKGIALTEYAIALHDARLAPLGFELGCPRDAAPARLARLDPADRRARIDRQDDRRRHRARLRAPDSIRLGLSPLTTAFADVHRAIDGIAELATSR